MKPGKPCPKTGKRSYSTHTQALVHGEGLLFGPRRAGEVRAYTCPFCHRWHLTTQAPKKAVDTTTIKRKK